MKITSTSITLIHGKPRLKAIAQITIDNTLIINDIQLLLDSTKRKFSIQFPRNSYAEKNHLQSIMTKDFQTRQEILGEILFAYGKARKDFLKHKDAPTPCRSFHNIK